MSVLLQKKMGPTHIPFTNQRHLNRVWNIIREVKYVFCDLDVLVKYISRPRRSGSRPWSNLSHRWSNIERSLDFIIMNTSLGLTWTIYVDRSQSWCQCFRDFREHPYNSLYLSSIVYFSIVSIQHLLGSPPISSMIFDKISEVSDFSWSRLP